MKTPPINAYGFNKLKNPPTYWEAPFASTSSGTPFAILANATPNNKPGKKEETVIKRSQFFLHTFPPNLLRYSNATPRRINATKIKNSGK